jgi:hypothetical protein
LKKLHYISLILIAGLFCQLIPIGNAETRNELIEYPITTLLSIIDNATNDQTVIIPSGEYIINERNAMNISESYCLFYQVFINRSVNLIAEPGGEVIIRSEIGTGEIILNAERIGFSGIQFIDVTLTSRGAPRVTRFNEVKLDNCTFEYSYDNYNRKIDNYHYQLDFMQLIILDKCSIQYCNFTRFTVSIGNVNETIISDSVFVNSMLSQIKIGRTEITSNEFIGIGSGINLYNINYAKISMNKFQGCLRLPNTYNVGYPISINPNVESCAIKENVFVDCTYAIFFSSDADIKSASIRDNTFDNCTYGIYLYHQPKKEFREKNTFNNTDNPVYYQKSSGYTWFDYIEETYFDEESDVNYFQYWWVVLICIIIICSLIIILVLMHRKKPKHHK